MPTGAGEPVVDDHRDADEGNPNDLRSSMVTLLLFVAMVVFLLGCTVWGWFG
ncbi:hypothetical protein GCM10025789_09160 [Tessaracoccus lubricantis]|uniref:Uncharacterized protein n=1 Tax=Tessaracoccus lubricantis TaxID=545543 RepID=A0ABP9F6X6_9ACTN